MNKAFFILYIFILLILSIFSYAFIDPNLIYLEKIYSGFAFDYRIPTVVIYITFILILFAFFLIFLWMLKKKKISRFKIKFLISSAVITLFFSYPAMLSYDIFNYIATAKVLSFYRENPYLVMPIEFAGDPFLLFMHAANKVALYGPTWILLTIMPFLAGFGNFLVTLLSFKLLTVLFYVGTIFLIWKISGNFLSVFLFSLNPLVVVETLISSHNDIVVAFLSLFAFFLLIRKKIYIAVFFLMVSILIKYSTIFLLPVFSFALYRTIKNEPLLYSKVFYYSALSMLVIFFLSPLREEIYPWYAIWFLSFASLVPERKLLLYFSTAISLGLLLRYIPFMLLGTYLDPVPFFKVILTFAPVFLVLIYYFFKEKIWLRKFFR